MIRCLGTSYRLHPLFVLMMMISVWTGYFVELITLFGIVLIHELGHVAAAKHYGWTVMEVQLFPFGGVAVTEETDTATSRQEIIVALAGPLQNVIMILLAIVMNKAGVWSESWSDYFVRANVVIGLFNLLPILPLDGGRILQAILSRYAPYYQSLSVSIGLSFVFSSVLLFFALFRIGGGQVDINLIVIAIFLLFSNGFSYKNIFYRFLRFLVQREHRTERMLRQGHHVQPIAVREAYDPITVAKLLKREHFHVIYVMNEEGAIENVLPEQRFVRELFQHDGGIAVDSSSSKQFVLK